MKNKLIKILGIFLWLAVPVTLFAAQPFNSAQLAPTPSNGNCLTTNGSINAWSSSCGSGGSGTSTNYWSFLGSSLFPATTSSFVTADHFIASSSIANSYLPYLNVGNSNLSFNAQNVFQVSVPPVETSGLSVSLITSGSTTIAQSTNPPFFYFNQATTSVYKENDSFETNPSSTTVVMYGCGIKTSSQNTGGTGVAAVTPVCLYGNLATTISGVSPIGIDMRGDVQDYLNGTLNVAAVNASSTATSTFKGGIISPCFATSTNGACITGGGGSGTVNSGTQGDIAYYRSSGTAVSATSTIYIATTNETGINQTNPQYALDIYDSGSTGYDIGDSTTGDWNISNTGQLNLPNIQEQTVAIGSKTGCPDPNDAIDIITICDTNELSDNANGIFISSPSNAFGNSGGFTLFNQDTSGAPVTFVQCDDAGSCGSNSRSVNLNGAFFFAFEQRATENFFGQTGGILFQDGNGNPTLSIQGSDGIEGYMKTYSGNVLDDGAGNASTIGDFTDGGLLNAPLVGTDSNGKLISIATSSLSINPTRTTATSTGPAAGVGNIATATSTCAAGAHVFGGGSSISGNANDAAVIQSFPSAANNAWVATYQATLAVGASGIITTYAECY